MGESLKLNKSEFLKYINGSGCVKTQPVVVWFALEWAEI